MKKGQVLLITVMLFATALTVALAVAFQGTTETQVSKMETDSQRALSAAEAAIESSLNSGQTVTIGAGDLSSINGISGAATLTSVTSTDFTSPTLVKDSSYTFYLGDYDSSTGTIGASTSQNILLCFGGSGVSPALEITLIKATSVKKYLVDPGARIANAAAGTTGCGASNSFPSSYTIPAADIGADGQLLVVRALYDSTKVLFHGTSNFPSQGRTATSQATTTTGVSKKVTLFQSNPQIPAEFFTTSF